MSKIFLRISQKLKMASFVILYHSNNKLWDRLDWEIVTHIMVIYLSAIISLICEIYHRDIPSWSQFNIIAPVPYWFDIIYDAHPHIFCLLTFHWVKWNLCRNKHKYWNNLYFIPKHTHRTKENNSKPLMKNLLIMLKSIKSHPLVRVCNCRDLVSSCYFC